MRFLNWGVERGVVVLQCGHRGVMWRHVVLHIKERSVDWCCMVLQSVVWEFCGVVGKRMDVVAVCLHSGFALGCCSLYKNAVTYLAAAIKICIAESVLL